MMAAAVPPGSNGLQSPLLAASVPAAPAPAPPATPREAATAGDAVAASRAQRLLQRCAAAVLAQRRADGTADPGKPELKAAAEHMRYFLPKRENGELLPLNCSDAEFAEHMGSGVAIYMHFVKMTMWMFVIASLFAVPQFIANASGHELELSFPLNEAECPSAGTGVMGLVSRVVSTFQFFIYAFLLGNVSFSSTYGFPHLVSELLLSTMFCIYVYWIWYVNYQVLGTMERGRTRASDFAVLVSRLPAKGSDTQSLRQHFDFFGEVASVCISTDHQRLLTLLSRHEALKTSWRNLHLDYSRGLRALRAETRSESGVQLRAESRAATAQLDALLAKIGSTWGELLRTRSELRLASQASSVCTGHAVIIFAEMSAAAKCVRHFELIRRHERSRDGGSLGALDFRQLYFRTSHKLDVSRAPEPSDILWGNLRASRLQARAQNVKVRTHMIPTRAAPWLSPPAPRALPLQTSQRARARIPHARRPS